MIQEQCWLYRATLVDSRDHEIINVPVFVALNDNNARLMAWAKATEENAGLDAGVVEFFDIVLERLGIVRQKRDQD